MVVYAYTQLLKRLKPENQLNPRVHDQAGQQSKTSSQKKPKTNNIN